MKREQRASIGPCPVPSYQVKDWNEYKLSRAQLYDFWRIVGVTVSKHQERFPLWMVFVAVYVEGLTHGFQLSDKMKNEDVIDYQI